MSLEAALKEEATRDKVIDDCVQLVDDEVGRKKGLGGVVIKAGYKAVKGIKPGFIRQVVSALLDRWAAKLDPIWQQGKEAGDATAHFDTHRSDVAEALLSVTDEKSKSAKNAVVAKTYKKLRPTAKNHVEEAVPGLASLLARHAG
jgi:hypothetical protein